MTRAGMKKHVQGSMIKQKREELGISQAELARRVGIKQPSLHNIEIGRTKKSRHLPEIFQELGLDYRTGKSVSVPHSIGGKGIVDNRQQDFPVYLMRPGSGEGMVLSSEPTEIVGRPAVLSTVPESFGICIWGNKNYPAYKAGDIVFVHPHQPPIVETDVVLRPTDLENMAVEIGELASETAKHWRVKPYNAEAITLPKSEWRCDRIVGKYNRR